MAARGVTQHQEAARPIMRPDRKARLSLKFCAIVVECAPWAGQVEVIDLTG